MAIYTGYGVVWNPKKNQPLCNLYEGPFTTTDKIEQEIMFKAGYKGDFEDELVIIEDETDIDNLVYKAIAETAENFKPVINFKIDEPIVEDMGVRELKSYCKGKGYKGYSNLDKADLLKLIEDKKVT